MGLATERTHLPAPVDACAAVGGAMRDRCRRIVAAARVRARLEAVVVPAGDLHRRKPGLHATVARAKRQGGGQSRFEGTERQRLHH